MEYTNTQAREAIAEHIHSQRDRIILEKRLIDGLTMERIAEDMQMSTRQIRSIIHKQEEILFKHL